MPDANDNIPLRQYVERLFVELEKRHDILFAEREKQSDLRHTAQRQALDLAKADLDRKLEEMNQFRRENRELTQRFVDRREFEEALKGLAARQEALDRSISDRITTLERAPVISRSVFEASQETVAVRIDALEKTSSDRLGSLERALSNFQGRLTAIVALGGVVALGLAILGYFVRKGP